jgi:hypothetical protein
MSISQVSNVNSVNQPEVQNQDPTKKNKPPSQPHDTVQLSSAATSQLKGTDADAGGQ